MYESIEEAKKEGSWKKVERERERESEWVREWVREKGQKVLKMHMDVETLKCSEAITKMKLIYIYI